MTRRPGSGFARATTAAVEEMTAATFANDRDVSELVRRIDNQVALGRCSVAGRTAELWLRQLAEAANLDVIQAETPSPDQLGDVRLTLRDGSFVWIEVKAQTKKNFADLLQADWVRDDTDALRWLAHHEPDVERLLSPWMRDVLSVHNAGSFFNGLEFEQLWLCDVALLPGRARRATASVTNADALADFLQRKYFLHFTQQGARLVRLDRLPLVDRVLAGTPASIKVQSSAACDARIWVSSEGNPARGKMDFVYYVGYRTGVVGRHKLHPHAVSMADELVEVP